MGSRGISSGENPEARRGEGTSRGNPEAPRGKGTSRGNLEARCGKGANGKEICGHCVSYDLWCGICLHPGSRRFEEDAEGIYEYPCCELFTLEDSYKRPS